MNKPKDAEVGIMDAVKEDMESEEDAEQRLRWRQMVTPEGNRKRVFLSWTNCRQFGF